MICSVFDGRIPRGFIDLCPSREGTPPSGGVTQPKLTVIELQAVTPDHIGF